EIGDQFCRSAFCAMVHAHVQRTIKAETETAFTGVELVAAHSKISEQSIDRQRFQVAQIIADPAEIGGNQSELWPPSRSPGGGKPVPQKRCGRPRIPIAIERDQVAMLPEFFQDRLAVAAAAERGIDINAVRADVQSFDTGL